MVTFFKKLFNSNRDLFERLESEKISATYLEDDDVFLMNFGKPVKSLSIITPDKYLVIHYRKDNYKITGFTVPNVQEFLNFHEKVLSTSDTVVKTIRKKKPNYLITPVATSGMNSISFSFQ